MENTTSKYSAVTITLNGLTAYDTSVISEFKIISDMDEGVPHGFFSIEDGSGDLFPKFDDISIGSKCVIEMYYELTLEEMKQKKEPFYVKYPDMYILGIENNFETNYSTMAGSIKIFFGHPWLLFKDIKNHCYEPMNLTELVKKVLKSDERGVKFEIKDDNFDKSDDNGKLSRYKCSETDWDFLFNKIVPYCCCEQNPLHLFCTEKGTFYLRSLKKLYKENVKVVFTGESDSMTGKPILKKELKIVEKEGLDMTKNDVLGATSFSLKIGSPQINKEWFPSFYLEDVIAGQGVSGNKFVTNKLKTHSGESFGNYLPLDVRIPSTMLGTTSKVVRNRDLDDAIFLLYAEAGTVDNLFQLEVESEYVGAACQCGDPAYVLLPYIKEVGESEEDVKLKEPWLNGKYIITRVEHYIPMGETKGSTHFSSKLTLSRSNFVGNAENTSLGNNLSFLYESP